VRTEVTTPSIEKLLEVARSEGLSAEASRLQMMEHAARRQKAVLDLTVEHGLSVRRIAVELGCSPSVIQKALRNGAKLANGARPPHGTDPEIPLVMG
jgi:DNA-binding CsgD family transcriptional regulator